MNMLLRGLPFLPTNNSRTIYYLSIINKGDMQAVSSHKVGFAIDIDGTLVIKERVIAGAREALEKLTQRGIPYLLLTNNISRSEEFKAEELNGAFGLSKPIQKEQVILSYTPIKSKLEEFKDRTVLVVGRQSRLAGVLPLPFLNRYITVEEYATVFPETVPLSRPPPAQERASKVEEIKGRLGVGELDKHTFRVGCILILTVPTQWEECFQIVLDLLSTEEGTVSKSLTYSYVKNHIPVMAAFNDLSHVSHSHNLPRILMKPFIDALKAVYKSFYEQELRIQIYGKPEVSVFEFAKRQLEGVAGGPIEKMVMVGDNEGSDILGASQSGWDSIMVKTGVGKHDSKYATINADNILEGVERYLES